MQTVPNNVDWSATAAWIALAISIITPTISLFLNNIHQRKLRKLELKYQAETEYYHLCKNAYEEFITQTSSHLFACGGNDIAYNRAYQNLFLYVPNRYWNELRSLNDAIKSSDENKIQKFGEVTKILASLLQERQKQIQEISCMPNLLTSIRNHFAHANKT